MTFDFFKNIIDNKPGAIAEVGVYKGASAYALAETFRHRTLHLFDTFSGMPENDPTIDFHKKGDFSKTSLEEVKTKLQKFSDVLYYKGLFPATAEPVKNTLFAFVNIDVDLYTSTRDCLNFFFPRLIISGILSVYDDYNFPNCKGATKAVDEFVKNNLLRLSKKGSSVYIIKEGR